MPALTIHSGARGFGRDPAAYAEFVRQAVETLITVNEWAYRQNPSLPDLYAAGLVYRREAPGWESFEDALSILDKGHFDCEDGAAMRVAWLRIRQNEPAHARITWQPKDPEGRAYLYHVTVRRASGAVEDPSRDRGMGNEPGEWVRRSNLWVYTLYPGRTGLVPAPRPVIERFAA